ncbi:MAG: YkgJ family cysteine cluster protein [Treponema sp.]|nr:YkgJ family cysteine cluster protein [Treponema sp.]
MSEDPFYGEGLRFSCRRCSRCCRHDGGFVFLSREDLSRLSDKFAMNVGDFIDAWCRWVPGESGRERLSLREKPNLDCVFWGSSDSGDGEGCAVYGARPLQCRAFPFWDSIVCSASAWKNAGRECPGIDSGAPRSREEIEGFLRLMEEELVIERDAPRASGG